MRFRILTLAAVAALIAVAPAACPAKTKKIHDDQKEKQWLSMENGPWWFAPDWYYYFLHKNYSGAEMYWKWAGFKSGYRVRFKEEKSNVKRIMPVRVTAEDTGEADGVAENSHIRKSLHRHQKPVKALVDGRKPHRA